MKKIITLLLTVILILFAMDAFAQDKNGGILFLEFRFIKGTPKLISMTAVKGKLKTRKDILTSNQEYSFEVLSNQKKVLYKNSFENPAEISYEYPGENGEIKRAEMKRDTVNFSLRIPYSADIDKIILYRESGEKTLLKTTGISSGEKFEFRVDHALIKKEN
jgi:hypothetical protein